MGLTPLGEGRQRAVREGPLVDPSQHRERDSAPLARAQGYIGIGGVLLGFLGVLLPHPQSFNVTALEATQGITFLMALSMLPLANRLPNRVVVLTPALGVLSAFAGVYFSGDSISAYSLFFLWPAFYAFYFLSRGTAASYFALVAVFYGLAILATGRPGPGSDLSGEVVHHYVIITGSVLVSAVLITLLRGRIERLWTQLSDAARTDLLTGLLNTRSINEVASAEVERARMGAQRVAMLTIQIGGVREVSKGHGQRAGENLIRAFGQLLDESTRRIDSVGRTGNTEFSIILPETDESTGFLLAEQLLARARRTFREQALSLAASVGVASFPKHASTAEGLIQASAAAVEAARALGSDRAVVYSMELEDVLGGDLARSSSERRTHLSTVLSLAEVLDLRDSRTAAHSLAVARYCEMMARELGLPEQRVQRLRLAGMLHDIGKVGIADSILDKPGPLSPAEWDEVRRHPELAARILGARELTDIREWVLGRHEQPDGHGYPRGVTGEAMPLESRILAVAESYDAMTSERPYRSAMTREQAISELGRYAGSQFDGAVVDALVRVLESAPLETQEA